MITNNLDCNGEIYDKTRAVEPKQEHLILRRFMRTSQHAARLHSEQVGQIVARLFAQTCDLEMEHVKETVFSVGGEAQIMGKDHPAMQELFKTRAGELQSPLLCLLVINDFQCFPFCMQKDIGWSAVRDILL